MGPAADETRGGVFQFRQLHLQLAFVTARALREDVEDEAGAIEHTRAQFLFQVAFLARRQRVIEDDELRAMLLQQGFDFLELARTDEVAGRTRFTRRHDHRQRDRTGGDRKFFKLTRVGLVLGILHAYLDEDRKFTTFGTIKKQADLGENHDSSHASGDACVMTLLKEFLELLETRNSRNRTGT
jgi:hypothetical protein